jgi:adenylosuccinate lyase
VCSPGRRYAKSVSGLRDVFSEYALIKYRVLVEIRWLQVRANAAALCAARLLQRCMLDLTDPAFAALDAV